VRRINHGAICGFQGKREYGKMDHSGAGEVEELRQKENTCRQVGKTFYGQCTVTQCIAHSDKLASIGLVTTNRDTRCAYLDFKSAGFPEDIDYAVHEQGFVGLRDLVYLSAFFGTTSARFKGTYIDSINLLQDAVTLLIEAEGSQHPSPTCVQCGHRVKETGSKCSSSSACAERQDAVLSVVYNMGIPMGIPNRNMHAILVALWELLSTGQLPKLIPVKLKERLMDLIIPSFYKGEKGND